MVIEVFMHPNSELRGTYDAQIEALISRIVSEQGRLDILVNNVFQVPDDILEWKPFWQRPINDHWSKMIDLGLRAHYVASCYAAPHMIEQGGGMIVNISSPGARAYLHSVIYGIGKAGTDKMMHDMGKELREHNVAALAIWPGIVKTERLQPAIEADALPEEYEPLKPGMESPEYPGRIIDAIASREDYMRYSEQRRALAGIVDIAQLVRRVLAQLLVELGIFAELFDHLPHHRDHFIARSGYQIARRNHRFDEFAARFERFERCVGVANILPYRDRMPTGPRWVTASPSGSGFVEVAERLIALRKDVRSA